MYSGIDSDSELKVTVDAEPGTPLFLRHSQSESNQSIASKLNSGQAHGISRLQDDANARSPVPSSAVLRFTLPPERNLSPTPPPPSPPPNLTTPKPILQENLTTKTMPHQPSPPSATQAQALSIFTPVNLILLSLAVYIIYTRLRPAPTVPIHHNPPLVFRTFTPTTLRPYNGIDDPHVFLAVQGRVFDVTAGKSFYGPGGPYSNFAGRDASRGLAKNSFDEDMLTDLDKPIDKLLDLNDEEKESLAGWASHFEGKYLLVGQLVEEGSAEAEAAKKDE